MIQFPPVGRASRMRAVVARFEDRRRPAAALSSSPSSGAAKGGHGHRRVAVDYAGSPIKCVG